MGGPVAGRLTNSTEGIRFSRICMPVCLTWRNGNGLVARRGTDLVVVKVQHEEQMKLDDDRRPDHQPAV